MNKALFLDIETTGFSRQWDNIIEIAAILYDLDSGTELDSFHEYIKPNKKIPAQVAELTGITNGLVAGCRSEKEVLMDFTEWFVVTKASTVIGHNCKAFDLNFIKARCDKYGYTFNYANREIIDTLVLSRQLSKANKITVENHKQPTLAEFFNIEYQAHSAIEDVRTLIKIYQKLKNLATPSRASLGF